MPAHPLHNTIGRVLDLCRSSLEESEQSACVLIKDPACVSGPAPYYVRVPQNIPLFCSEEKGNDTEYCNVDALILLNGKIKVIMEIEESSIGPTQIFGKFLASAAAHCYIHTADGGTPIYKDDDVVFIQIMDTSSLKPRTSKREQWKNIETSIRSVLPLRSIRRYFLLHGDENDFGENQTGAMSLINCVVGTLRGEDKLGSV
jgi:hypothetical protein